MQNLIFALIVNKCLKFLKELLKYIEGKGENLELESITRTM